MKKTNILTVILTVVIASAVIVGGAYAVKTWQGQERPGETESPQGGTDTSWQTLVGDHIRNNISELSPKEEVLGGTFHVTSINFSGTSSAIVEYEDGHQAHTAQAEFNVTPEEEVTITSFELMEEDSDLSEGINFSETGNLTQKENGNWQLVYEKPGQPALTTELNFTEDSKCITTTGDNGEGRQETLCSESSWEQGARAVVNGIEKNEVVEVVSIALEK